MTPSTIFPDVHETAVISARARMIAVPMSRLIAIVIFHDLADEGEHGVGSLVLLSAIA